MDIIRRYPEGRPYLDTDSGFNDRIRCGHCDNKLGVVKERDPECTELHCVCCGGDIDADVLKELEDELGTPVEVTLFD